MNEAQILLRMCRTDEKQRLIITPIISPRAQFQPTSVDLRLGTEFLLIKSSRLEYFNLLEEEKEAKLRLSEYTEFVKVGPEGEFVLHPRQFALGCTLEYVALPPDLAGRLEGKSTWGRMGLQVHSTAGFVDPGFAGALTFELQNAGAVAIPLYPGMTVAQICFIKTESSSIPCRQKYSSQYGGWAGLQGSRYYQRPDMQLLRRIRSQEKEGD